MASIARPASRLGLTLLAGAALVFAIACEEDEPEPAPTSTAETTATATATSTADTTQTASPTVTSTPEDAETPEATETPPATSTPGGGDDAGTPLGRQVGGATCDALFPEGLEVGQEVEDVFVCIDEPSPGDSVSTESIEVSGWQAGAFEQNVVIELRDADGNVLVRTATTANAPDIGLIAGEWTARLEVIDVPTTDTGTIAAFSESARDGSIDFGGEIEVTFE